MTEADIYNLFPTEDDCLALLERLRWNGTPACTLCGSTSSISLAHGKRRLHCNICNASFSPTAKTVFHRTRLSLRKWFAAIYISANAYNRRGRLPACELERRLNINKNTASKINIRLDAAYKNSVERQFLLELIALIDEFSAMKAEMKKVDYHYG